MVFTISEGIFNDNVRILKSEVSKTAYQGVVIALFSIVIATCLVSVYQSGEISISGIVRAQKENIALWMLDGIPFIFGIWGQYSSSLIAYQAGVMVFKQTEELRNKNEHLEKQANYISTHDAVTDLPNRALFYDRVERLLSMDGKPKQLLSLLLIEIENFKDIYDTLGRNSSDLILRQISRRLYGVSRERNAIAKIDSNVFGFLLTDIDDLTVAERVAQRIQQAMEQPFMINRQKVPVHSAVGIAHFPDHGQDVDTLVQRAGLALHIAQRSSSGYAVYQSSFDQHSPKRLTLMSELRHAIQRGELELFYQAKVCIHTGRVLGAEGLVRWRHPLFGIIPPDEFIPVAERTRTIKQVTAWVLQHAFLQCADWHKQGMDIKVSVNLSAKDLHDPELPDLIAGIAVATAIIPEWIVFEITESSVMSDPESAFEIINRLHGMGYQFSIDDFGTGYSSLAYLKKLPLAELKIDKSFVLDIMSSDNDAVIVNATINLAHNLGLKVTAEGVETSEVMARLKNYGCDVAQGYLLNKPLSVADFNQWLKDRSPADSE